MSLESIRIFIKKKFDAEVKKFEWRNVTKQDFKVEFSKGYDGNHFKILKKEED